MKINIYQNYKQVENYDKMNFSTYYKRHISRVKSRYPYLTAAQIRAKIKLAWRNHWRKKSNMGKIP